MGSEAPAHRTSLRLHSAEPTVVFGLEYEYACE